MIANANPANGPILDQEWATIPLRVLIVDDDQSTREMLADALQVFGAEARYADGVAEACATMAAWQPDLLISDLGMPVQNGYELIRHLRTLSPDAGGHIPALALTGNMRLQDHRNAIDSGFNEVLTKPAELDELLAAIRRVWKAGWPPV